MQDMAALPSFGDQDLQIGTPFEVPASRPMTYRSDAVTATFVPAGDRPLVKGGVALAALSLLIVASSGARLAIDGLRAKTRAPAVERRLRRPPRWRKPPAAHVRGTLAKLRLLAQRWAHAHPRIVKALEILRPREPNQPALGTGSLRRSARWKALGGHGRNGPGAHS